MLKKSLILFMIGSSVTSSVFAANFFQQFISTQKKEISKLHLETQKKAEGEYTDFSGTWSGTCFGDNMESSAQTITIENDDESFTLDGNTFQLGSIKTDSTSTVADIDFEHILISWNNQRDTLFVRGFGVMTAHDAYPYNHPASVLSYQLDANFAMKEDQLAINGSIYGYIDNPKDVGEQKFQCALNKIS